MLTRDAFIFVTTSRCETPDGRRRPADAGICEGNQQVAVGLGIAVIEDGMHTTLSTKDHRTVDVLAPLARRIRAEYLDMRGLSLTIEQAQRLWCLDRQTCEALMMALTDARFLRRTIDGLFVLRSSHVNGEPSRTH
jgi:hypothetical protein